MQWITRERPKIDRIQQDGKKNRSINAFVDGITAAVVGALAGSVIV